MAIMALKSTDPRKAEVMSVFKSLYNCRKVTNVRAVVDRDAKDAAYVVRYIADCMNFNALRSNDVLDVLRDRRIRFDTARQTWQVDYSNPGVEE